MKQFFKILFGSTLSRSFAVFVYFFCVTGYAQQTESSKNQKAKVLSNKDSLIKIQDYKSIMFNGKDGPYIVHDTVYWVNSENKLIKQEKFGFDSLVVRADNLDANEFYVSINSNYEIPESEYDLPEKMVVISDIEGKYDAFAGFLYANKVIDANHNWIFGNGHLVLVGDFVDRGKNVTQVLWLIYKMEDQARLNGGQVHFILGNHEVLNFQGKHNYNRDKYIKVAQEISGEKDKNKAIKYMFSENSELGQWLATKNVIEKIGDYLFVHGGLSPELLAFELTLAEINQIVRSKFHGSEDVETKKTNFLYGSKGPFWYRGLAMASLNYTKIKPSELDAILTYYDSKKMVVGHTIVEKISSDFESKVIRIDVPHGYKKFSGKTKGLLIENGKEFIIDDRRDKSKRPTPL